MKAPSFSYIKARTLPEVFHLLGTHGEGARLLAGGQSLLATLNLRLASPELLIDITGISGLSGIRNAGTFGGSIALADPAAEWPACCVALKAEFVVAGDTGSRRVAIPLHSAGLLAQDPRSGVDLSA